MIESRNDPWRGLHVRPRLSIALFVGIVLMLTVWGSGRSSNGDLVQHAIAVDTPQIPVLTDGLEDFLGPIQEYEDGFTIVAPTFNRTSDLPTFFAAYGSGTIPSLRRVVILWNNPEPFPPAVRASLAHYPVEIVVEERQINSKNQRFRVSEHIRTAAVLAIDDDIIFEPEDAEFGYQAWRELGQRRRMVGFIAREATENGTYLLPGAHTSYSMVLTKCSFIHIDWMKAWWKEGHQQMEDIRLYIDSRKLPELYPTLNTGCEDIAMSFVYAHHARTPPLLVKAPFRDLGLEVGISVKPGHLDARTECVRHFMEMMGDDTLISTEMYLDRRRPGK